MYSSFDIFTKPIQMHSKLKRSGRTPLNSVFFIQFDQLIMKRRIFQLRLLQLPCLPGFYMKNKKMFKRNIKEYEKNVKGNIYLLLDYSILYSIKLFYVT